MAANMDTVGTFEIAKEMSRVRFYNMDLIGGFFLNKGLTPSSSAATLTDLVPFYCKIFKVSRLSPEGLKYI